jgi:hypothetical protein
VYFLFSRVNLLVDKLSQSHISNIALHCASPDVHEHDEKITFDEERYVCPNSSRSEMIWDSIYPLKSFFFSILDVLILKSG